MKIKLLLVCVLAAACAVAQTSIPVTGTLTLSGTLDASAATASKPAKTGTTLPATCGVGEVFYKTDATAGSNIYGCTATNTWTAQAGGGISDVTAADGTVSVSGTSIKAIAVNQLETATHDSIHQNKQRYFAPSSGSATTYAGTMGACPSSYYTGMVLDFKPDATNTGAATVNVCTLGAKSVKASDGSTALTAGALVSGKIYSISYDGTNFRMPPRAYDKASWGFCAATNCAVSDTVAIPYIAATASTINKCFIAAGTAPTGSSLIVDVLKNGSSIFGGGTKLVLAAAATSGTQSTFATTALAEGDVLTATITQVGSTITGKDIGVVCRLGL